MSLIFWFGIGDTSARQYGNLIEYPLQSGIKAVHFLTSL